MYWQKDGYRLSHPRAAPVSDLSMMKVEFGIVRYDFWLLTLWNCFGKELGSYILKRTDFCAKKGENYGL